MPRTVWRHHSRPARRVSRRGSPASAGLLLPQLQPSTPGRQTPGGRWPGMPASTTLVYRTSRPLLVQQPKFRMLPV